MKKLLTIILATVTLLSACLFTGCNEEETTYSVTTCEFYFSTDNGSTYGNRRVQFNVGESVYMQVQVEVTTNKKDKEDIACNLKIPYINAVDAYYLKGQKITPTLDEINDITTYPFIITTNENWKFFFEFVPTSAARVQMELLFDDKIDAKYNVINTIDFIVPGE